MPYTERLAFQRNTTTADTQGGRASSWATFATIWASVEPLSGAELIQAAAMGSQVKYRVRVAQQQLEDAAVAVASITRSSTTATVTTSTAHGLTSGQYARLAGATQTAYNAKFAVTVTSTTVGTFTVAGSPTTPATGTITLTPLTPIRPQLRFTWTPSWDSGQAAKTLQIHVVRLVGRDEFELDCGEVI